jgi:DeoR/GlpR family transcriptional regulator of sugar metabolism
MNKKRLLSAERLNIILERVSAKTAVDYESLAIELNVSKMTVRRDVQDLVSQGYMKVTRGGASAKIINRDILLNPRSMDQSIAKSKIGQFAASLIEDGETIFLGPGSTTAAFAQFLPNNLNLTVITASLPHASILVSRGIKVISIGGIISTLDMAASGIIALETIDRFFATRTVIGAGGLSKKIGLTERDQEIADLNRAMVARCESLMVLLDSSKINLSAPFQVCGAEAVDEFITTTEGRALIAQIVGSEAEILSP